MIKEIQYTNLRRVLDNIMEHPLLRDVTIEQAARYTLRFICLHGYPKLYKDKEIDVPISCFRGMLPCDLVSIIQVRDKKSKICLRSMTDDFNPGFKIDSDKERGIVPTAPKPPVKKKDYLNNAVRPEDVENTYIPPSHERPMELSFKTQGRVIYTSFPEGCLEVMYKAIPVDDDGFPLLIDNENYLAALEAYIKVRVFTIKFDTGKISAGVLQNAQQEYYGLAAELTEEFQQPSMSEAQTLTNIYNTLIVGMHAFDHGFVNAGNREYLRRH